MKQFAAFSIVLMLIVLCTARAAPPATDPSADVPRLPPITATGVVCVNAKGQRSLVVAVITYPNGQVLRFDPDEEPNSPGMHGFTVAQLQVYANTAKDVKTWVIPCPEMPIT